MKLDYAPSELAELNNITSVSQFTIKANAKAFAILSDGLYSNKIRAIIRELSTNAYDSHVAAGTPELPFDVNIPSILYPWFSVRDYGVGLDHEEVLSIYTSYFTSTKTDSNNYVGALGLGSKSPFCYTKNFSVIAIKNGIKRFYSAYINEQGFPSIALMEESKTDDKTGVEIKLAVNERKDFFNFREEALNVYSVFKVKPKIVGITEGIPEIQYAIKDIIKDKVHLRNRGRNPVLVMGNIEYPIKIPTNSVTKECQHLLSHPLELNVDIGFVEMSANREDLSYTSHTISNLNTLFAEINLELGIKLNSELSKRTNLWDKADYISLCKNQGGIFTRHLSTYLNQTKNPFFYCDYGSIYTSSLKLNMSDIEKCNAVVYKFDRGLYGTSSLKKPHKSTEGYIHTVDFNSNFLFLDSIYTQKTIQEAIKKQKYSGPIFVFMPSSKTQQMDVTKIKSILLDLPDSKLYTKSLNFNVKSRSDYVRNQVVLFDINMSRYDKKITQISNGLFNDIRYESGIQYLFLEMKGSKVIYNGKEFDHKTYLLWVFSNILDPRNVKIYGLRNQDLVKAKSDQRWKNLIDEVDSIFASITPEELVFLYRKTLKSIYSEINPDFIGVPVTSSKYCRNFTYIINICKKYYPQNQFLVRLNQIEKYYQTIDLKYPLLKYIDHAPHKEIQKYRNLIDKESI